MTFSQAFRSVKEIAVLHSDSAALEVEGWYHHHADGTGEESLRWSVYSVLKGTHHTGTSAEQAVSGYRKAWQPPAERGEELQAALDEVGSP